MNNKSLCGYTGKLSEKVDEKHCMHKIMFLLAEAKSYYNWIHI